MDSYSVKAVLSATDSGFTSTFAKAGKVTESLGGSIGGAIKQGALLSIGMGAVNRAVGMVTSSMGGAIKRFDTLHQFPKIMEQLGFGAEEAAASTERMSAAIDGLPTSLDEMTSSVQSMALITGDLDKATDTAIALNNAFLSSGSSSADAARGLTQYSQMLSAGKVDMQSWRTLLETMGPALNKVANSFGFAGASAKNDLYDALKSGKITFDELNDRIIKLNDGVGGFADLAKTSTTGIATNFQNLKTAVVKGLANTITVIDDLLTSNGFDNIAGQILKAKGLIDSTFKGIQATISKIDLKGVAAAAKPYWNALRTALSAVGGALKAVGGFLAEHAGIITKLGIPLLMVVGGFRAMMVVSALIGPLSQIGSIFTKLAGGVLARLAPQLVATGAAEAEAGAGASAAAGSMLRLGAAVLMIGAGIGLVAVGFALLTQSAIALANSGGTAIAVMFGFLGAMTAMMAIVSALGPALLVGAAGALVFGVAVLMIAAGVLIASKGLAIMAKAFPAIASTAGVAAKGLLKFAAASASLVGVGLVARGIAKIATASKNAATGVNALSTSFMKLAVYSTAQANIAITKVMSKLSTGASKAKKLGANLSKGFASGMRQALGTVTSAANDIVRQAEKVIKAKAKIKSPSRLTKKLGGYFGEGFALGITGSTKMIQKASANMVSIPSIGMANGFAYAGALSDNYSYGTIEVPLYINGREFAKATSDDMQSELSTKDKLSNRKRGRV